MTEHLVNSRTDDSGKSCECIQVDTIGHSTRAQAELIALLPHSAVATPVDVCKVRSGHTPPIQPGTLTPFSRVDGLRITYPTDDKPVTDELHSSE